MRINLYFSEENEKELIDYLTTKRDAKSYIKDLIFYDMNNIVMTSKIQPKEEVKEVKQAEAVVEVVEVEEKKKVDAKKVMKKNRGMMLK